MEVMVLVKLETVTGVAIWIATEHVRVVQQVTDNETAVYILGDDNPTMIAGDADAIARQLGWTGRTS